MLGSNEFKKRVTKEFEQTDISQLRKALENKPQAIEIIKLLCTFQSDTESDLQKSGG